MPHKSPVNTSINVKAQNLKETILHRLEKMMCKIRGSDPQHPGCPWSKQQDFHSLRQYLIEECYEVLDALEKQNFPHLEEELGDLFYQILFIAQISKEKGLFSIYSVLEKLYQKMTRRHPHVFTQMQATDLQEVANIWQKVKAEEKKDSLPLDTKTTDWELNSCDPILASIELQQYASSLGFDWKEATSLLEKVHEEANEVKEALEKKNKAEIEDEMGDLLFTVVNLCRFLKISPHLCLVQARKKFGKRLSHVIEILNKCEETPPYEIGMLKEIWAEAKIRTRNSN